MFSKLVVPKLLQLPIHFLLETKDSVMELKLLDAWCCSLWDLDFCRLFVLRLLYLRDFWGSDSFFFLVSHGKFL